MSESQCTLARPVEMQGIGLFFGQPVQLRCRPAPAGSGIVFVRADPAGPAADSGRNRERPARPPALDRPSERCGRLS